MAVSGIYEILNLKCSRRYIGSSVNINRRLRDHKLALKGNYHPNKYLQRAWNKYGEDNFEFSILEECDKNDLIKREQFWINSIELKYNILKVAGSAKGYIHSEVNKLIISQKIKESWNNLSCEEKEKRKERLRVLRKNYVITEDHKQKLRDCLKKTIHSENSLKKRIKILKKINYDTKRVEVLQFSTSGVFIKEHKSIKEAGEYLNLKPSQYSTIGKVCKGKEGRTQAYGYIWKYKK